MSVARDGKDADAMRRPVLVRFGSDTFMDDLRHLLDTEPGRLVAHVAVPTSYRSPPVGASDTWTAAVDSLKLYLPFHGDFNLVAASLVCRRRTMPDHTTRPADGEEVAFVLRRLEEVKGRLAEVAWTDAGGEKGWSPVEEGKEQHIAAGEQLFPMFPVNFSQNEQPRRLFVGLVPVSSGETFKSAGKVQPFPERPGTGAPTARSENDPRWEEFDRLIVGPLMDLRDPIRTKKLTREELYEPTAFLLLDLADFLRRHLPDFWTALDTEAPPSGGPAAQLYTMFETPFETDRMSWRKALVEAWKQRTHITGEDTEPPSLELSLMDSTITVRVSDLEDAPGAVSLQGRVRALLSSVKSETTSGDEDSGDSAAVRDEPVPKIEPGGTARYRIRCVYRRPRCAPFPTDHVSAPTVDFAIASIFDPDAPARQIRIPMPFDTSIKDLRKFRKNVGFVISNQLRAQMNRVTDLKKALDGDLGEAEEWNLGMICQFSIPIITICALVVLMIFLVLLNIVFFWLPFFKVCLPVPVRSKK
jgi:hypothetical protein